MKTRIQRKTAEWMGALRFLFLKRAFASAICAGAVTAFADDPQTRPHIPGTGVDSPALQTPSDWAEHAGPMPAFRVPLRYSQRQPKWDPNVTLVEGTKAAAPRTAAVPATSPLPTRFATGASRQVEPLPGADGQPVPNAHFAKKSADRPLRAVPHDDATLINVPRLALPTVTYPVMIYRSSDVVLIVPQKAGEIVRTVALWKRSGADTGSIHRFPCKRSKAMLHGLTDGSYDVYYLPQSQEESSLERPCDRRILIELAPISPVPPFELTAMRSPSDPTGSEPISMLPAAVLRQDVVAGTDRGWDLLRRGAAYTALREFSKALDNAGAGNDSESMSHRMEREVSRCATRKDLEALAVRVSGTYRNNFELAATFYGMGKAYDAIRREVQPLIHGADRLAAVCYLAAHHLDSALEGPLNELGIVYIDLGWPEDSKEVLERAAFRQQDAISSYNLGRIQESAGQVEDAVDAFGRALAINPELAPAAFERARLALRPDGRALYASDFGDLIRSLRTVTEFTDPRATETQWAIQTLGRLSVLEEEIRLNEPGFVVRRLLPPGGWAWQSKVVAVAAPPTRAGGRTSVSQTPYHPWFQPTQGSQQWQPTPGAQQKKNPPASSADLIPSQSTRGDALPTSAKHDARARVTPAVGKSFAPTNSAFAPIPRAAKKSMPAAPVARQPRSIGPADR